MEPPQRVDVLGAPFDAISFDETLEAIRNAIIQDEQLQIIPGSIDMVMKARRDPPFGEDMQHADLVVADGVPIVWAASLLGTPIRGRVSGTDMVTESARISAELDAPVAMIGGAPGVADRACDALQRQFPAARLHVIDTPERMNDENSIDVVDAVRKVEAKILHVALGAPRQERWIARYLSDTGANVGLGIGSAFDIISGDTPRAPAWMADNGFEWLHRMRLEPRRLGRRYLVEDSPFIALLAREVVRRRVARPRSST